jgi:hypothetical protein
LYLNASSLCILILPSYHDWKVFFINSILCTPGTFIVPGSVQHTPVVIKYLVSEYNAFVFFQEVFIFLFDGLFPFCCIFDVLVFRFDSSANHLNVEPIACGSKPLLLSTCHCCGMVFAQFFNNCLTIKGVVAVLNGLVFSSSASIEASHVIGSTGVAVAA